MTIQIDPNILGIRFLHNGNIVKEFVGENWKENVQMFIDQNQNVNYIIHTLHEYSATVHPKTEPSVIWILHTPLYNMFKNEKENL